MAIQSIYVLLTSALVYIMSNPVVVALAAAHPNDIVPGTVVIALTTTLGTRSNGIGNVTCTVVGLLAALGVTSTVPVCKSLF